MEVQFVESKNLKEKPTGALGFGKYYTDYMFVMDWDAGLEWHDARVVQSHCQHRASSHQAYPHKCPCCC